VETRAGFLRDGVFASQPTFTRAQRQARLLLFLVIGVLISWLCDKRLRLVQQLSDADRRKDEFLATLAHELRNPLAPISNALQLWPMVENDRTQMGMLREMLRRQVGQMVRLIDDLMDVSRIAHGKIQLRCERIDIVAVASEAIEAIQPFIKSRGHELSVALPAASLFVMGDSARLTQVFGNVLHNAAKYTGTNGSIRVVVERKGQTGVFRVKDDGPGVPSEMLSRIFEMFEQVDRTLGRSHGGIGIGLTLAKRLIEMHHGSIEAFSEWPGKGSEFVVTLPIVSDARDRADHKSASPSLRELPQHRIPVVDDLEASATTLAMLMCGIGQDAYALHDGRQAVEWVHEHKPDIVFLDIAMPGMDGLEAARRIRQVAFHHITLVALSGYGQDADRQRAFAPGFDHYLTKPVNVQSLCELLSLGSCAPRTIVR
jgi:signal transduction histidine kinase/ActR/RegA family two-component response regulator